jgi:N6-adenosine-specific RNA methylase IME4
MIKKYNIIYADPPWNFKFKQRAELSDEAKGRLYDTMKSADIINLRVGAIADDNCILFLWGMNSELPLALKCIESWGFLYKTVAFTWVKWAKNTYHFGGGNWTRSNPELCLLATKGKIKRKSASVKNLVVSKVREHSKKPDEIRDYIIELVGDLPRIELFARTKTEGWDVWGNEVECDMISLNTNLNDTGKKNGLRKK